MVGADPDEADMDTEVQADISDACDCTDVRTRPGMGVGVGALSSGEAPEDDLGDPSMTERTGCRRRVAEPAPRRRLGVLKRDEEEDEAGGGVGGGENMSGGGGRV